MDKINTIAFMNMKGGVGKTTLCVNIADCLSKHFHKKVLLIDLDPQFNATQYLISQDKYMTDIYNKQKTIYSIFKERNVMPSLVDGEFEINTPNTNDLEFMLGNNLSLISGDLRMISVERSSAIGREHKLAKYIENNSLKEKYDFILIDCPPTQSIYTIAAFFASNYYVVPVKPDFLSTLGINLFQSTIKEFNEEFPHRINCLGLIFTLTQEHTNHGSSKMEEIRKKFKFYTFDNYIKQSIKIPENAENNICLYDIGEDFKQNIINITQEFLETFENRR